MVNLVIKYDDSFAKKDDLVTLSFISENLQKAIVSFAGQRKTFWEKVNLEYNIRFNRECLGSPSELDSLILWVDANNVDGLGKGQRDFVVMA